MTWESFKLKDLGQIIGGGTPSTGSPEYFGDDYPWITPKDLAKQKRRFVSKGERGLSYEGLSNSSAKIIPAGSVVISSRAPIGLTALTSVDITTNQGCKSFVPGPKVEKYFMYYLLKSLKGEFLRKANGSTFLEISGKVLSEIEVVIPPIEEQRIISSKLAIIDEKIESNLRIQSIGEQLLRSIVQGALISSKGPSGNLGDYCENVKNQVKIQDLSQELNYIGFEHMPRGSIVLDRWGHAGELASNKTSFKKYDVLFGKLRPYFKKVGVAPFDGVASTDILILRAKQIQDTALVAAISASDSLINSLSASATGTRMPRASWEELRRWPVKLLSNQERQELSNFTKPLLEKLMTLSHENMLLEEFRELLTAELLSEWSQSNHGF